MEPQPERPKEAINARMAKMRIFVEFMNSSLLDSDLDIERNTLFAGLNGLDLT